MRNLLDLNNFYNIQNVTVLCKIIENRFVSAADYNKISVDETFYFLQEKRFKNFAWTKDG